MTSPEKKSKGRQKVAMVRMEKESNRLVTFSKRRSGLFKKASELCTLCGVEVAIVVFSPGRKTFSFGHPAVDTIINRYLNVIHDLVASSNRGIANDNQYLDAPKNDDNVSKFSAELSLVNKQILDEKKRNEELAKLRKLKQDELRWLDKTEELDLAYLKQIQAPIITLGNNVFQFGSKLVLDTTTANPFSVHGSNSNQVTIMSANNNYHPSMVTCMTKMGSNDPYSFIAQNALPFQGTSNPIEMGFVGPPLSFNMGMDHSMPLSSHPESFSSLLMVPNLMNAPNVSTFNHNGEFGFGPRFY